MGVALNNGGSRDFQLVETKAFAANAVTFSGLSGDYVYKLEVRGVAVDTTGFNIEINGDTTANHYFYEWLYANAAAVAAENGNSNLLGTTEATSFSLDDTIYKDGSGYAIYFQNAVTQSAASTVVTGLRCGKKIDAPVTEITSIKILKSALGTSITGSAILYKMKV